MQVGSSRTALQQDGHCTVRLAWPWCGSSRGPAGSHRVREIPDTDKAKRCFKAEMASALLTCSRAKILPTHRVAGARHGLGTRAC